MNEYGSLESTKLRSPDNQSLRQSLTARTRAVLQNAGGTGLLPKKHHGGGTHQGRRQLFMNGGAKHTN